MRTFYVFKINKEFKILTKKNPYNLFYALNNIKSMSKEEVNLASKLFNELCDTYKSKNLNKELFDSLKETDYYTKFNNNHIINNYYTDENSKLTVKNTYLKIKSSKNKPLFFNILKNLPNLFVIDFDSKDYFWLS